MTNYGYVSVLSFPRRRESRAILHNLDSPFQGNDINRVSPTYISFSIRSYKKRAKGLPSRTYAHPSRARRARAPLVRGVGDKLITLRRRYYKLG